MTCALRDVRAFVIFFFFNDTATTEIYTLSLHDALPISARPRSKPGVQVCRVDQPFWYRSEEHTSELQSHSFISYAVFCLKKKPNTNRHNNKHKHTQRRILAVRFHPV